MKEKIKSGLLIFNVALLGILFFLSLTISLEPTATSGPIYGITRLMRGETAPRKIAQSSVITAAYPYKIAAISPAGVFGSCKRDEIAPFYEKIRPLVNESIGSAENAQEITIDEYIAKTMSGTCFYLEYDGRLPLYAMRIWCGTSGAGFDYSVRNLNFCKEADKVSIAFYDYATDKFYACETAADPKTFDDIMAVAKPNGVYFANEDAWYAPLKGDELVFTENFVLPVYEVALPAFVKDGELPRAALDAFAMSQYLTNVFEDADKARVYVQGGSVLRLERNGRLVYSSTDGDATRAIGGDEQRKKVALADRVRAMAESVLVEAEGTKIYLKAITPEENGKYEIIFGRERDGISIGDYNSKPIFARIENGAIVYFEMQIYSLSQFGEEAVLPYHQAMAALPQGSENLRLSIRYGEKDGKLTPYLSKTIDAKIK